MLPHSRDSPRVLLARHCRFLSQAAALVAKDMGDPKTAPFRELLLLLTKRLDDHEAWLSDISECHHGEEGRRQSQPSNLRPPKWGPIAVTRKSCTAENGSSGIVLQIDGPAVNDTHTAAMESEQTAAAAEADIEQYSAMACLPDHAVPNALSKALARAAGQAVLACSLSTVQPPRPTHDTVSDAATADAARIARLKEYNDLRDIAQQLIGILADNRGVPVRFLYSDGSFGVGVND